MNKRILIISYYWPPSAGSGVQRWLKFAKYLPEYGWSPVIYTPENPDFKISDEGLLKDIPSSVEVIKRPIWEPYALAKKISGEKKINTGIVGDGVKLSRKKKLMNWVRGNLFIPDPRVFWVKPSINHLLNYLSEHPVDVIVSTGPPHSMHLIGLGLKKKLNKPWIVDIRDPWSKLDFLDTFYLNSFSRNRYQRLEQKVLDACDGVLATSPSMIEMLRSFSTQKFKAITNGFDQNDIRIKKSKQSLSPRNESKKYIKIYHAGLLNQVRNPTNLWKAIQQFNEHSATKIMLHLAGMIDPKVLNEVANYPDIELKKEDYKSHDEVLDDYQESDILLLLVNNTDNAKVNIPGKLFEYLANKKPIIMIGSKESDAAKILRPYNHTKIFDYEEEIDLYAFLSDPSWLSQDVADDSFKHYSRHALTGNLVSWIETNLLQTSS